MIVEFVVYDLAIVQPFPDSLLRGLFQLLTFLPFFISLGKKFFVLSLVRSRSEELLERLFTSTQHGRPNEHVLSPFVFLLLECRFVVAKSSSSSYGQLVLFVLVFEDDGCTLSCTYYKCPFKMPLIMQSRSGVLKLYLVLLGGGIISPYYIFGRAYIVSCGHKRPFGGNRILGPSIDTRLPFLTANNNQTTFSLLTIISITNYIVQLLPCSNLHHLI